MEASGVAHVAPSGDPPSPTAPRVTHNTPPRASFVRIAGSPRTRRVTTATLRHELAVASDSDAHAREGREGRLSLGAVRGDDSGPLRSFQVGGLDGDAGLVEWPCGGGGIVAAWEPAGTEEGTVVSTTMDEVFDALSIPFDPSTFPTTLATALHDSQRMDMPPDPLLEQLPLDFGPFVQQLEDLALELGAPGDERTSPSSNGLELMRTSTYHLIDDLDSPSTEEDRGEAEGARFDTRTFDFPSFSSNSTRSSLGDFAIDHRQDSTLVTPRDSMDLIDFTSPVRSSFGVLPIPSSPNHSLSLLPVFDASPKSMSSPLRPLSLGLARYSQVDGLVEQNEGEPNIELEGGEGTSRQVRYDEGPVQVHDEQEEESEESEEEEEEEEDPDSHPLYTLLSTSTLPALRSTWYGSTLILVPPRRTLPTLARLSATPTGPVSPVKPGFEFVRGGKGVTGEMTGRDAEKDKDHDKLVLEALETYVALHAFRPDGDVWKSVGGNEEEGYAQVRLEPARGLAHVEWVVGTNARTWASRGREPDPPSASTSSLNIPHLSQSIPFPLLGLQISSDSDTSDVPRTPPLLPSLPLAALRRISGQSRSSITPSSPPPRSPTTLSKRPQSIPVISLLPPRALQMVSETTIYRRLRRPATVPSEAPPPPPPIPVVKVSKPGFRAPKWLRRGSSANALPVIPAKGFQEKDKERAPLLERVRVIALDGEIAQGWPGSALVASTMIKHVKKTRTANSDQLGRVSSHASLLMFGSSYDPTFAVAEKRPRRAPSVASSRSVASGRGVWASAGSGAIGVGVGGSRDFLADIGFLASPPSNLAPIAAVFIATLETIHLLVRDFEASFAYIKGFDAYTVQRIRKGILDKAWSQLTGHLEKSEAGAKVLAEERTNLQQLVENVVMGLLHTNIYTSSVLPLFVAENAAITHILSLYQSRDVSPADLGVDVCDLGRGEALRGAVAAVAKLGPEGVVAGSVPTETVQVLLSDSDLDYEEILRRLVEARTPLGCISAMRLAIEEVVAAVEATKAGSRVAPDDLIPLLAWVTIQSGAVDFESMLYYVKTFRLSDSLAAELDWSFVTFQAALAFLLSDPLGALPSSPIPLHLPPHFAPFPSSALLHRRASELPSFRSRRLSLHNPYTPAATSRSPPTSPRALRVAPPPQRMTPAQRVQARAMERGFTSSGISPVHERHLSWHSLDAQAQSSAVELDCGQGVGEMVQARHRGRPSERKVSNEEMPPPSWNATTKHQRRQSLGVLPSSTLHRSLFDGRPRTHHEATIHEGRKPATPAQKQERRQSTSSLGSSAVSELQIRPRIILPVQPRTATSLRHETSPKSPPLGRPLSSRQIGPFPTSSDMRRSESDGSTDNRYKRSSSDIWSLWAATSSPATSERAFSPSGSDAGHASEPSGEDRSWWNWGKEQVGTRSAGVTASPEQQSGLDVRARRYSASAAELFGGRTNSLPVDMGGETHARLVAILAARSTGVARPRPRSIMSISSIETESALPILLRPLPIRTPKTSLRSLTISQLGKALAPQLDSSTVLSFPTVDFETTLSHPRTSPSPNSSVQFSKIPPIAPPKFPSPLQRRQTGF